MTEEVPDEGRGAALAGRLRALGYDVRGDSPCEADWAGDGPCLFVEVDGVVPTDVVDVAFRHRYYHEQDARGGYRLIPRSEGKHEAHQR